MRIIHLLFLVLVCSICAQIELPPESRDYQLFLGNDIIGYYSYVLDPVTGGWNMTSETFMAISAGGKPGRVRMMTAWELDSRMRPERYEIAVYSNDQLRQRLVVEVSGEIAEIIEGEVSRNIDFPSSGLLAEMNVLDGWILLPRLINPNPDSSFALPILIPQMVRVLETRVFPGQMESTAGAPSRKFSIKGPGIDIELFAQLNSRTLTYWTSPNQGITARLAANLDKAEIEETASGADILELQMSQDNIVADLNIDLPLNLKKIKADINISLAPSTRPYYDTAYQEFKGDFSQGGLIGTIGVDAEGYSGDKALSFPVGPSDIKLNQGLGAEPKIESSDSMILNMAIELSSDRTGVWAVAVEINRFVADNIEIDGEDISASRTLALGKGSGLSHARLCTALLRSLGIPARIVGGVLLEHGFWLRHHWVEVWTGKKHGWIPIDPTTGEDESFSAAHITLWFDEGFMMPSQANSINVLEHELRK
ncbi:MAG: transglutaminase-like domain-containing protein [bacterium]